MLGCYSLLLLLALGVEVRAQSFDRLMLRPRSTGGNTYEPGEIRFYDSRWPSNDPEIVGLQARDDPRGLERYDLTLPPAAAEVDSCIFVDPDGTMYFVATDSQSACRAGRSSIYGGDVGLGSQLVGQASWEYTLEGVSLTGVDPYWISVWAASGFVSAEGPHGAWVFALPGGVSDPPVLNLYVYSSSAIGPESFAAWVGCMTPNEELISFGAVELIRYVASYDPGEAGRLHILSFELSDNDWEPNDLCIANVAPTTNVNVTKYLWMEVL